MIAYRCLATMLVLAAATPAAGQKKPPAPPAEEIVGWYRTCEVSIDLAHGKLNATRTLTDDGKALFRDDSASWIAADYGKNELGLSIDWLRDMKASIGSVTLPEMMGKLQVFLRTPKKLVRNGLFRLKSSNAYGRVAALASAMGTGADRRLAGTVIELDDVIRYASGLDALYWSYENLPRRGGIARVHAAGTIAMTPFREAVAALGDADRLLTAKATKFATECKREPDYYNPLAEI